MESDDDVDPSIPGTRAVDPRPARTRQRIFEALDALAHEDDDISVFRLAKRAQVSRAAFYSHFTDIEDVAAHLLIPEIPAPDDATESSHERAVRELHLLVDSIVDRRTLVRSSCRWKLTYGIHRAIISAFAVRFMMVLADRNIPATEGSSVREDALYCAGGTLTTLMSYLDADVSVPTEEIRRRGHQSVDRVLTALDALVRARTRA